MRNVTIISNKQLKIMHQCQINGDLCVIKCMIDNYKYPNYIKNLMRYMSRKRNDSEKCSKDSLKYSRKQSTFISIN